MMGTSALRRLVAEFKQLSKNSPDGIIAGPIKDDNYFEWEAAITGRVLAFVILDFKDTLKTESFQVQKAPCLRMEFSLLGSSSPKITL